jgi:hypothetical protein
MTKARARERKKNRKLMRITGPGPSTHEGAGAKPVSSEEEWPKVIKFKFVLDTTANPTNPEPELTARIDNLQVGFFVSHGSCFIVVWGEETYSPCTYDAAFPCCQLPDNCPHETTRETQDSVIIMTESEGTRTELEEQIRAAFKYEFDRIAPPPKGWPQPAAHMFATLPWEFDIAL